MVENKAYTTNYRIENSDIVDPKVLEAIDYHYQSKRDVDIVISQPEFTSVCPMTGLPDFSCIAITYTPRAKIIELKSLKYYLLQYRNVGIFYEHVVNRILDDLVLALDPKQMEVRGNFSARGGIEATVSAIHKG